MEAGRTAPKSNAIKPTARSVGVYKNEHKMVLFCTLDGADIRLAVSPAQRLVDVQVALTEECAC
eukprot:589565-Karenia_brevis.AAC.1